MEEHQLVHSLAEIVGSPNVLVAKSDIAAYSEDALGTWRGFPDLARLRASPTAVVRPQSTQQVAAVVRLAAERQIPVVPYGGGSGLMGGALSVRPGIVIDLKAMDKILSISPEDRMALVQAGVVLARLEEELNKKGLILGHDPWSLPIATVGGAISTNGLGYRGAEYGSMGDQVLGLAVVLPDGSILRTRPAPKSSVGIDLNSLFVGGEGCFGIITEAAVRVFPMPESRLARAYSFDSFEEGFTAIAKLFEIGLKPALIDYGETHAVSLIKLIRRRFYEAQKPTLYMVFEGFREKVEAEERRASAICRQMGGKDLGQEEAAQFWETRHWIAEQYARFPGKQAWSRFMKIAKNVKFDFVHVSLPQSRVLEYYRRCRSLLSRHKVRPLEWGVWTQPELFSVAMVKVSLGAERAERDMARAVDEALALAHELDGSMEYCHGAGMRLAHLMGAEHGIGLEVMRRIKRTLDPNCIMNPGKLGL